jgi:hypothetical protein
MRTTGELQRMSKASDVKTGADLFLGSLRSEVGGGAKTATDSSAEGRVKNEEPTFREPLPSGRRGNETSQTLGSLNMTSGRTSHSSLSTAA